ncbi:MULTISPECIES: ArsR family transcriptional regulator [unclassified Arcicella]|nr:MULTISPECIES: ArsR family transcriptional regulator [unclassified Arcicella]
MENELHLNQPSISQHLKELKNARIIKGNSVCYCIN